MFPRTVALAAALALLVTFSGPVHADPPASPAPSSAPAPRECSVVGAGQMLDTYTLSGGQAEGYAAGDRVRVMRGGTALGEGSIFSVAPHTAVLSAPGLKLRKGDQVVFVRHKAVIVDTRERTCIYTEIKGNPPGAYTEVENKAISGRVNFFYYYTPSHAKCKELDPDFARFVEKVKQTPGTALFVIDVGYEGSPLARAYHVDSLPTLGVMSRAGQWVLVGRGHGCREVFNRLPDLVK